GPFAVSSARAVSAPNGLAVTASLSTTAARAWFNTAQPADVQVSADVYLDTLIPAQVFARGSGLNTTAPSYYAASLTRGMQVQLVRVVNGVSTTLGGVTSANWFNAQWVSATLYVNGSNVRAQVRRLDTAQFLNASGQWQADPTWALNLTDTGLTGGGGGGEGRPAGHTPTTPLRGLPPTPAGRARP